MIGKLLNILIQIVSSIIKIFFIVAPSLLVLLALKTKPQIELNPGKAIVTSSRIEQIHEIMPNTRWGNLKPCGVFLDERKEFDKAKQCANDNVYNKDPIEENLVPRCFVVSSDSPDVFTIESGGFNAIVYSDISGPGAIVGFYQTETKTLFLVENEDIEQVYRHELQHMFIHIKEPETGGGGHYQKIWKECEPQYYNPSIKVQIKKIIKDYNELKDNKEVD